MRNDKQPNATFQTLKEEEHGGEYNLTELIKDLRCALVTTTTTATMVAASASAAAAKRRSDKDALPQRFLS